MTDSSFSTPLQKYGNSWVLRVPPKVAKLYKLGDEVKVTIEVS
jgi:antitoxin component of MazEF toxin-antitoxin module